MIVQMMMNPDHKGLHVGAKDYYAADVMNPAQKIATCKSETYRHEHHNVVDRDKVGCTWINRISSSRFNHTTVM